MGRRLFQSIMMYRNLLYTGITRAKKRVVLIGQKQVLFMAIHRNEIGKRNTLLGMRIQMYFKAYAKKAGIPIPAVQHCMSSAPIFRQMSEVVWRMATLP